MAGTFTQRIAELERRIGSGKLTGSVTCDQVYAHFQHERADLHHPRGGGPFFLQKPLFEHYRDYIDDYAKTVLSATAASPRCSGRWSTCPIRWR